uniref:Uncharacterized protein n=3 Tax=Zea mays TaxID=4577 RepID=Q8HBV3_MAIZE|nr:unknown [Zea mays]ABE98709.1 orf77-1 [Zea mays subsp. mays]AAN38288.1 unknown [Zea mays]AAN40748.1 unknown [Zea mays]WCH63082.1 hypothetical protein [Zea mays subsp. mays]
MFASFDSMMAFLISFVFRVPFFFCLAFLISFVFRCIKSHIYWCRYLSLQIEMPRPLLTFWVLGGKKSGLAGFFHCVF